MIKNQIAKNILSIIAVAGFGFILLNAAFLFDYLFQTLVMRIINFFTPIDILREIRWFPPFMHSLFVIVIGLISWAVFCSKLKTLYKAIYMTVPIAVVLVTVGILLYRWPIIAYLSGSLLSLGVLYYFHRTRQPWIYYYTVISVGIALAIFTLLGGEI